MTKLCPGCNNEMIEEGNESKVWSCSKCGLSIPDKKDIPKRYCIDFYDMIDGWIGRGPHDTDWQFDTIEEAKKLCIKLQKELDQENIDAGEHYGVIDMISKREVFCCQDKSYKEELLNTLKLKAHCDDCKWKGKVNELLIVIDKQLAPPTCPECKSTNVDVDK